MGFSKMTQQVQKRADKTVDLLYSCLLTLYDCCRPTHMHSTYLFTYIHTKLIKQKIRKYILYLKIQD